MLEWLRVSLAFLLTLVFGLPLAIIAKAGTFLDEPVVMLVLDMLTAAFLTCCVLAFMSTADALTANKTPPLLCFPSLCLGTSIFVAFKLSTLFLAVEQFIAVAFPLRHFAIMSRWAKIMTAFTWVFVVLFASFGLLAYFLGLESTLEFDRRMFGVQRHISQCHWERAANVYVISCEVIVLLSSITSCALLIYTAIQGFKQERRLAPGDNSRETQRFIMRFKPFKRIFKVLLTLLVFDIVSAGFRIGSRWFLPSTMLAIIHSLRILGMTIECWTYGFSHRTVRNAIKAPRVRISSESGGRRTREPGVGGSGAEPSAAVSISGSHLKANTEPDVRSCRKYSRTVICIFGALSLAVFVIDVYPFLHNLSTK